MNWIVAGLLMFTCSVAEYLLLRKAAKVGMPLSLQNLSCFLVPLLLYVTLTFWSGTSLIVNWYQLLILVVSAIFFSYLGNKFSLLSIKYAPNPGYSLVLSKSYVVMTTLVAVVFFQAELTITTSIAIFSIVTFSSLIMIDPKPTLSHHSHPIWLPFAIGAFLCWGMLAISSKYLQEIGVPIYTLLVYLTAIVSTIILGEMRNEQVSFTLLSQEHKILFVVIGILFTGFNYFMQLGFRIAPNIGYINAMNAASIALVAIGATIFFHDEFSVRKFIGVIGVIAGLILLVL